MAVCAACRNGRHPHDRWTDTLKGTRAGDDAGCPNLAIPGDIDSECACDIVLAPTSSKGRRHCPTCRCGGDA